MNEERMNEIARRLGAKAAERLDVAATAQKVVERLREPPAARVLWIHHTWVRIAATVVVLVGGAVLFAPGHGPGTRQHPSHLVADDLGDLSTDELRDILTTLDETVTTDSAVAPDSSDLRGLDARDLRAVLRDLEG